MKILKLVNVYIKKFIPQFCLFIISSLIVWLIAIVNPYITGSLIDSLVSNIDQKIVYKFTFLIAVLSISNIFFQYIVNLTSTKLNGKIAFELSYSLYDQLKKAPLTFFKSVDSTYLSSRINEDCNNLIMFFTENCINLFTNILTLIFGFFVVFYISSKIAIAFLIIVPVYILIYKSFRSSLFKSNYTLIEKRNKYFSVMTEQFKIIKYIKINVLFDEVNDKLKKTFHNVYTEVLSNFKINYLFSNLNTIIIVVSNIIVLLYGGILVINKEITIGNFTILNTYFSLILNSTKYFMDLGRAYQQILVSVERIEELKRTPIELNGTLDLKSLEHLEINNLHFSFDDRNVINDFSCKFEKGNIYCVQGDNGSGKSTLLNLLTNIYQDYNGEIYYNNIDLKAFDMYIMRKHQISYTIQNSTLISGSVYENLTYGIEKGSFSENDVYSLCDMLNLTKTIMKLPDGYKTMVSDDYEHFSGGEKQKIAIIRSLLKDSPLIILDEPTSAFDRSSTMILKDYLKKIRSNKIIILITHDSLLMDPSYKIINFGTKLFYESTS